MAAYVIDNTTITGRNYTTPRDVTDVHRHTPYAAALTAGLTSKQETNLRTPAIRRGTGDGSLPPAHADTRDRSLEGAAASDCLR
jgi:hypothetical protein